MRSKKDWALLSNAAHKAIKILEKRNTTHAEAFYTNTQTTEVTIRNSEILAQNKVDDSGVGFRVTIADNKTGFACTNTPTEKAISKAAEKALAIARVGSGSPNFALPKASRPRAVKGLFDPRLADMAVDEAIDIAERTIRAAEEFDKRVIAKDGRVLLQSGWRGITNTLDVDLETQETKALMYLGGAGKQNSEVTSSCYEFIFTRKADLDPENVGESVGKKVVTMFKPQPLKGFQGAVIFAPEAVSYQLVDVLIDALKGETVMAGRSAWTEKLGQIVASENLTIIDNATLENGFSSRSFDDEGYSSQTTVLIEKGKLESFLHNATSADTLETENTGNASRYAGGFNMVRSIIGSGYRTKPEIYPSNLIIKPGNKKKEELISEMEKGVLVESMAGFPQPGSGLISAQLSNAFFIHNGEIQFPIQGGMVSGIAYDWLQQISQVSEDTKQFQNSVMPTIRIEDVNFVGA